jgi:hypothetical protein
MTVRTAVLEVFCSDLLWPRAGLDKTGRLVKLEVDENKVLDPHVPDATAEDSVSCVSELPRCLLPWAIMLQCIHSRVSFPKRNRLKFNGNVIKRCTFRDVVMTDMYFDQRYDLSRFPLSTKERCFNDVGNSVCDHLFQLVLTDDDFHPIHLLS